MCVRERERKWVGISECAYVCVRDRGKDRVREVVHEVERDAATEKKRKMKKCISKGTRKRKKDE